MIYTHFSMCSIFVVEFFFLYFIFLNFISFYYVFLFGFILLHLISLDIILFHIFNFFFVWGSYLCSFGGVRMGSFGEKGLWSNHFFWHSTKVFRLCLPNFGLRRPNCLVVATSCVRLWRRYARFRRGCYHHKIWFSIIISHLYALWRCPVTL